MASQIGLNGGQLNLLSTKFYQLLAIFYLIVLVRLCKTDSSNEIFKYSDNNSPIVNYMSGNNPSKMNGIREVSCSQQDI